MTAKLHDLKCWPDFFEPIRTGAKTFDLRKDDRHFTVGDVVRLREFDDKVGKYTGRELEKKITYVLEGVGSGSIAPIVGLLRGYTILGFGDEVAR